MTWPESAVSGAPRRHGRQVGDALVLVRGRDVERGALADHDRRQRAGQEGGSADDAGRQSVPTDDDVVVGEQRDLRVAGAEQAGGERGQPVEGCRAGYLYQEPAGGGDPLGVVQRVDVRPHGRVQRGHASPFSFVARTSSGHA
jgi:hypothetical protein